MDYVDQKDEHSIDNLKHNLVDGDKYHSHFSVPGYSFINPTMGAQFIYILCDLWGGLKLIFI